MAPFLVPVGSCTTSTSAPIIGPCASLTSPFNLEVVTCANPDEITIRKINNKVIFLFIAYLFSLILILRKFKFLLALFLLFIKKVIIIELLITLFL